MMMMTEAEVFVRFRPVAMSLGKQLSRRFNKNEQELQTEAMSILAEVAARWNRDGDAWRYQAGGAAAVTWAYKRVFWALTDYCRRGPNSEYSKQNKMRTFSHLNPAGQWTWCDEIPTRFTEVADACNPPQKIGWLDGLFAKMGEDARMVVMTIISAPAEIAGEILPNTRRRAKKAVQDYLAEVAGWDRARVLAAWDEARAAL